MRPCTPSFIQLPVYSRIRLVNSFDELATTRFEDGINALCWERSLPGDFAEVVERLATVEGVAALDDARLENLHVSEGGRVAIDVLLEDQRLLRGLGLTPVLDCIRAYPRDENSGAVSTDVYSFHADSAPVEADTWLCTYHGSPSEGLRNEQARRRIDIPETRFQLLEEYGGEDDEGFRDFLSEYCYDLHYASFPEAEPFSFGLGNLWRIAVEYPDCPVPPCVHRAPASTPGDLPRLLLIS
jgi:hypothetical protein